MNKMFQISLLCLAIGFAGNNYAAVSREAVQIAAKQEGEGEVWKEQCDVVLKSHRDTLEVASTHFFEIPGFQELTTKVYKNAFNEPTVRGLMYEIQCALYLREQNRLVAWFGKKMKLGKHMREFDLGIGCDTVVECKTINWKAGNAEKLLEQLRWQKKIANKHKLQHVLYSKNDIPKEWQEILVGLAIKWVVYNPELVESAQSFSVQDEVDAD